MSLDINGVPTARSTEREGGIIVGPPTATVSAIRNTPNAHGMLPAQEIGWPNPKPLPNPLPPVELFDFAWLPDTLRPAIQDISHRMQCPPDFPAVSSIVSLGSLIGRKIGIRPKRKDDWLVVPNVWGCVIGRAGVMKTPAVDQALAPLRQLEAEAEKQNRDKLQAHLAKELVQSQRAKIAKSDITKDLKAGDHESANERAEELLKSFSPAPKPRRYFVNDATIPKLGEILSENPSCILVYRDELSGFLYSMDKEGHEDDRSFFLETWNGTGAFTFDRIGRGTVRCPSNTIAILGGITPDVLNRYIREAVIGGGSADGLLQRFQLAVWPDISTEWQHVDKAPDQSAKDVAKEVFAYIDKIGAIDVDATLSDAIPFLRFTPEAQDVFDNWLASLEKAVRGGREHPAFEGHLAKFRKLVPALALILHLTNRDTGPVRLGALEKALHWARYLETHARRIYAAAVRPSVNSALELADHLSRGELDETFSLREVYRNGWTALARKEDAEAATDVLCELDWIRAIQLPTTSAGGRPPGPSFLVNPKIYRKSPDARSTG